MCKWQEYIYITKKNKARRRKKTLKNKSFNLILYLLYNHIIFRIEIINIKDESLYTHMCYVLRACGVVPFAILVCHWTFFILVSIWNSYSNTSVYISFFAARIVSTSIRKKKLVNWNEIETDSHWPFILMQFCCLDRMAAHICDRRCL